MDGISSPSFAAPLSITHSDSFVSAFHMRTDASDELRVKGMTQPHPVISSLLDGDHLQEYT
mgnify:FL=1